MDPAATVEHAFAPRFTSRSAVCVMALLAAGLFVTSAQAEGHSAAQPLAADESAGMEELTQLMARDPSRIHATARRTRNHMAWKWIVYLPPGKTWQLRGAVGRIPQRGQPIHALDADVRIEPGDASRIVHLEGHISRPAFDAWVLMVEADRCVFEGVDFAACGLHSFAEKVEVAEYITGQRPAKSQSRYQLDVGRAATKHDNRLELVHWCFEPQNDARSSEPPERMPGLTIWIEAVE